MRVKLALNFVFFVLLLYAAGGLSAIGIFKYGLHRAMDSLLIDLLAEIRPSVQVTEKGVPSLKSWANVALIERMPVLATIQLFNKDGTLLERYGPAGVPVVHNGRIQSQDKSVTVMSLSAPVTRHGTNFGILEVQASTAQDDRTLYELIFAVVIAIPIIGGLVAAAGYIFAGMALRPVERTMDLLRHFVADAGHELKTPLSVIEASVETLQEIHAQHNISSLETEMIRKASDRMKGLTADLIFLAKVEDPMAAFDKVSINLNHLVEEVADEYLPLAATRSVGLTLVEEESDIYIMAEPESFRQLLSNLLSNAIKYTDPGGKVNVLLKRDQLSPMIVVSDTGIGITDASLPNIFDRFYRTEKSRSRDGGGAGLGLAIVKAVADAHHATVTVESEIGKGSTFIVFVSATG